MRISSVRELIRSPSALRRLLATFHSFWGPQFTREEPQQRAMGRGESLMQLHETQNRVITSIYKISISGFVAIFMILLSFTLFLLTDPASPVWLTWLLAAVELLLIVGFARTLHDYRQYQKHYQEVSTRMRDLLHQQFAHAGGSAKQRGGEHRLIAALKPKEHKGWDAKHCTQCEKAIELTASVCQHCGQQQQQVYMS